MYDNTGKIFWISFITSFFVSIIVVLISVLFVIPNISFLNTDSMNDKIEVPMLEGLNVERAKLIAMNKNLALFIESEKISEISPKGLVMSQSPLPGTNVIENSVINVVISAGKEIVDEPDKVKENIKTEIKKVVLPHYAGLNIDDVQRDIIRINLQIGDIKYTENDKYPSDVVIKTEPISGLTLAENSAITIYVSKGAGAVTVPNVYRLSKSAAIGKIQKAGLKVNQTNYTTDIEYPFDIVIRQNPKSGTKVSKGSGVTIWINSEM